MGKKNLSLSLNKELYDKLTKKSKKLGYENIHEYIQEILRRNAYHSGGARKLSMDEDYLKKFATHTKESRKIARQLKNQGLM